MGERHDSLVRSVVWVQATGHRRVALIQKAHEAFEKLDRRWKKKLETHFKHYGLPGTTLPREHFRSLGRFPSGGPKSRDVQLFEFKAFQCRIYGVAIDIGGAETFVGFELVDDKKKHEADQDLLKRVAKKFGEYLD